MYPQNITHPGTNKTILLAPLATLFYTLTLKTLAPSVLAMVS